MTVQPGKLLSTGNTAEVYALDQDKVIKLFYFDEEGCCAAYESGITDSIIACGGPAAQTFGTMQIEERHGIVLERIPGRNILQILTRTPWKARRIGRLLAQLHARIHLTHVPELRGQAIYLPAKIELSKNLLGHRCNLILAHLQTLPAQNQLCHGDFHPQNAMMSANGLVALDWAEAYSGNCYGDVAKTYLQLTLPHRPKHLPAILNWLSWTVQKQLRQAYLSEYMKIASCSWQDIEPWIVPMAASWLEEKTTAEQAWLLKFIDERLEKYKGY